MSPTQNSTLHIFLSSTAIDMLAHRQKVTDALLRLDNLPVRMETFGAIPSSPVEVCKTKVLEANALVVMLAHRYGWVPTVEEGGDGKKSITWIEVETAIDNHIPVFAFIVDENYGWTQAKEQDEITRTKDAKKIEEIVKNVQSLNDFKVFLNSKAGTRDTFSTPEVLALNVATSLSNWISNHKPAKNIIPKRPSFVFRTVHHLQPAPHFKGRKKLLDELKAWWQEPVTPDRVRSLVAIGGTGKTAVVQQFLESIKKEKLRGSVLVWSFYDEPNTDAFLREACIVFTGAEPEGVGGRLETLQRVLASENNQHMIILDGLERVQSEGKSERARGDLEDHRLKNLLRAIAAGLGNTRALITTRFKLTDLAQYENAGYKSHELDVLDRETAIEVLKAWGVKGDDEKLARLAALVGNHALSVSVYGSYLNHYCNCDPDEVREFKLDEISPEEPLAARLARILGGYAKKLSDQERDLIVRLSVFPKGVTIDILGYLTIAGGEIAGTLALIGANQKKLSNIAENLKKQGLIYSYKSGNTIVYTAHPFLREYFRNLLGVKPEDIHDMVRNKLSIGLDTKPKNKPSDVATLDRYEKIIEHSILGGHYNEALELYENVMGGGGGANHIFHILGDYGRMIRIISLFTEDTTPQTFSKQLSDDGKSYLLQQWGLASRECGDLKTADFCMGLSNEIAKKNKQYLSLAQGLQNNARVNILKGKFPSAKKLLEESLNYLPAKDWDDYSIKYISLFDNAYLAYSFHSIGKISLVNQHFSKATEINEEPLDSYPGVYEIEHFFRLGEKEKSLKRAKENLVNSEKYYGPLIINLNHYMLGILSLPVSVSISREHLLKLREWTEKSGHMECIIRSHILASEIAFCSGDYPAALAEATTGLNHADSCGFGQFAIDLLLQLSKVNIAIPDYKIALSFARQAFERSANPECSYAWGEADGAHLCGVCHKALKEYELARQRLTRALELREKIQHPEAEETRKLLAELPKQEKP